MNLRALFKQTTIFLGFILFFGNSVWSDTINVDFLVRADPPLFKKFAMYNSGIVPMSRYRRDIDLMTEVRPESFRIDLSIGKLDNGWINEIVTGTPENLVYDFTEIDELSMMLNDRNILPYWCWCYIPLPLQTGSWRSGPSDLNAWKEMHSVFASHFKQSNLRIGYHEMYNEPNISAFYLGTWAEYLQMYKYGVQGIKEGDPDAVVGGPASAGVGPHLDLFLDFVIQEGLPLDFLSFHS